MAVAQATLTVRRKMTEEKFLRLPDARRKWERVNGEAREVPAGHRQDVMVINIGAMLKPFARGRGFVYETGLVALSENISGSRGNRGPRPQQPRSTGSVKATTFHTQ